MNIKEFFKPDSNQYKYSKCEAYGIGSGEVSVEISVPSHERMESGYPSEWNVCVEFVGENGTHNAKSDFREAIAEYEKENGLPEIHGL